MHQKWLSQYFLSHKLRENSTLLSRSGVYSPSLKPGWALVPASRREMVGLQRLHCKKWYSFCPGSFFLLDSCFGNPEPTCKTYPEAAMLGRAHRNTRRPKELRLLELPLLGISPAQMPDSEQDFIPQPSSFNPVKPFRLVHVAVQSSAGFSFPLVDLSAQHSVWTLTQRRPHARQGLGTQLT